MFKASLIALWSAVFVSAAVFAAITVKLAKNDEPVPIEPVAQQAEIVPVQKQFVPGQSGAPPAQITVKATVRVNPGWSGAQCGLNDGQVFFMNCPYAGFSKSGGNGVHSYTPVGGMLGDGVGFASENNTPTVLADCGKFGDSNTVSINMRGFIGNKACSVEGRCRRACVSFNPFQAQAVGGSAAITIYYEISQ